MKTLELQPTTENLVNTYINDTIGRNEDLHRFIEILDSIEDSCSIALDGKWGSGKTFFVMQVQNILECLNEIYNPQKSPILSEIKKVWDRCHTHDTERLYKPHLCVYYDAWKFDNDDDPLLSLIYEIHEQTNSLYDFSEDPDYTNALLSCFNLITENKLEKFINSLKNQNNLLDKTRNNRNVFDNINLFFEKLLHEKGERLIIFIDELDRCKPSYAVQLLERVKHYFNHERVTFVFSINGKELQNTIKQYYGEGLDANKYLDRFFDLRLSLPVPDMERFYESIGFLSSRSGCEAIMKTVISKYNFSLREITKYMRLTNIAVYKPTHLEYRGMEFSFDDGMGKLFCLSVIIPIMIGLKIHDSNIYLDFVEGGNPQPLIDILSEEVFKDGLTRKLLNSNETFDTKYNSNTIRHVELTTKIEELYTALFIEKYDRQIYTKDIGSLSFDRRTKTLLDKTVNLLSSYAIFDYV